MIGRELVRLVIEPGRRASLALPADVRAGLGLGERGGLIVRHGARRAEAELLPSGAAARPPGDARTLLATRALAETLRLEPRVPYRLRYAGGELTVGPVVGILAARRAEAIDLGPGSRAHATMLRYPALAGLCYFFGAEDLDLERQEARGFAWVPVGAGEDAARASLPEQAAPDGWAAPMRVAGRVRRDALAEMPPPREHPRAARFARQAREFLATSPAAEVRASWNGASASGGGRFERGVFPLPQVIWVRSGCRARLGGLRAELGIRVFNSRFFDKEEGHRLLSLDPDVAPHLPATEPLGPFGRVLERLSDERGLVLKRAAGESGHGLLLLELGPEGYELRLRDGPALEFHPTGPALEARVLELTRGQRYLVQQHVRLPRFRGRLNDYRVFLQKDDRGHWAVRGMLGRFGARGRVVTSFSGGGYALPASQALRLAFGAGEREAHRLGGLIEGLALATGRALDRTGGCYGDLALDVGLDRERRAWLFEANKLPFHEMLLYMGDQQTYLAVASGPLLFAAHLAGFGRAPGPPGGGAWDAL